MDYLALRCTDTAAKWGFGVMSLILVRMPLKRPLITPAFSVHREIRTHGLGAENWSWLGEEGWRRIMVVHCGTMGHNMWHGEGRRIYDAGN